MLFRSILTVKSDDVTGRVKTYEAIVKGHNVPTPGVPESFKVLVKELQSLCLDIKVLDEQGNEIELRDEDEDDVVYTAEGGDDYVPEEEFVADTDEVLESGYNYDEEQDEDTFSTVLQEVVAEAAADSAEDDYE